jgi:hypothetical protein
MQINFLFYYSAKGDLRDLNSIQIRSRYYVAWTIIIFYLYRYSEFLIPFFFFFYLKKETISGYYLFFQFQSNSCLNMNAFFVKKEFNVIFYFILIYYHILRLYATGNEPFIDKKNVSYSHLLLVIWYYRKLRDQSEK